MIKVDSIKISSDGSFVILFRAIAGGKKGKQSVQSFFFSGLFPYEGYYLVFCFIIFLFPKVRLAEPCQAQ